ncbi:RNA polymerase sigma factor [Caulobacter sp. LARHSG274]
MDGFFSPAPVRPDLSLAVESLFRRYDTWFRRVLRKRYGDMADDLAQEAYLRTAMHDAAGEVRHPKAFLMQVANNLAIDRLRRQRREEDQLIDGEAFQSSSTAASQEYELTLKQIVLALPPELRDVFVLSHINGLTHRESALQLGLTERTVKDRMRRASIRVAAAMRD